VDGPVKASDFTDADGDGRAVLSLYRLAAGYTMAVPAAVSVRRTAAASTKPNHSRRSK